MSAASTYWKPPWLKAWTTPKAINDKRAKPDVKKRPAKDGNPRRSELVTPSQRRGLYKTDRRYSQGRSAVNYMPKIKLGKAPLTAITRARYQAGNHLTAGLLLYRVNFYFGPLYKGGKLDRDGREWIAKSRADWALEAGGLTEAEIKSALTKLRECSFIRIEQWKLSYGHPKMLWISLDLKALEAVPIPFNAVPTSPPTYAHVEAKPTTPTVKVAPKPDEPLATLADLIAPINLHDALT